MNLQELCITIIVDEFDRYYSAFSKSDDANLKRKLEFLQRVYSFQILTQLSEADGLRTEYIDLLVNKYLKILDTDWLRDCPWKTVVAKFAEVGSSLHKVYFHEFYEEVMPWQDVIHHLTSLEVFSFHECTDEILKSVSKSCPNIVEIDVSFSSVTDEGIKYLCMKENGKPLCPKLKKVLINSSDVKEEGVTYLIQNLRSLEVTDYDNISRILYSIHQNDLPSLNNIEPYNLTTLDLLPMYCVPHYTNLLKVCLSVCPFLKSLSCPVSNKEHLALFSSPLELEKLHLECFSNTEIDVTDLIREKGRKLTSLTVTLCSLSVATLSESCPGLKQLFLNQVTFKSDDNITPSFKCLETCIFNFSGHDSLAVKSVSLLLKYSPKLEHIGFKRCDLSSSELRAEILKCCECCPIKKINFTGSEVDTNFIKAILISCRSLKSFRLDNCSIGSDEEYELYDFAQVLPNNPEISFCDDELSFSDTEDDIASVYGFDFDDYDDYDDFYHDYDGDDYDYDYDNADDDYGFYFEL